jgi:hypothetical protein
MEVVIPADRIGSSATEGVVIDVQPSEDSCAATEDIARGPEVEVECETKMTRKSSQQQPAERKTGTGSEATQQKASKQHIQRCIPEI